MSQSAPGGSKHAEVLTDHATLEFTVDVLSQHFDLEATGYRCQTHDLWQVLVAAAAHATTIEATCRDLAQAPDSNTVRGYLTQQLTPEQVRPRAGAPSRSRLQPRLGRATTALVSPPSAAPRLGGGH